MSNHYSSPDRVEQGGFKFKEVVSGLYIAEAALSKDLTDEIVDELANGQHSWRSLNSEGAVGLSTTGPYRRVGENLFYTTGRRAEGLKALGSLAAMPVFENRTLLNANRQDPGARQNRHPDSGLGKPVFVVHASDDGNFEYYPNGFGGKNDRRILEVGAGDIVRIDSNMPHAGVNPSDHTRYNAILYNQL